ncbi:MAG: beta strand repeat-containing protein [Planctomycetaceae bacterium]
MTGLGLLLAGAGEAPAIDLYWSASTTASSTATCTDGGGSWQASASTSQRWFNPLTGTTQFWGSGASSGSNATVQNGANNGSASTSGNPMTIGSTGGSNNPNVGAIVFAKAGSNGYFLSAGGTATNLTSQLTIHATGTSGVSAGTGILVNFDVVGDTTFTAIRSATSAQLVVNLGSTASQTWTNNSPTYALIFTCNVAGAGKNLTTNGVGTVTLSATNTFNNLTVGGGTLKLTNSLASGTGSLTVNSGGNLSLLAPITKSVANSGTITIGAGGGLTAASIGTGALSLAGASGTAASFTSTSASSLAPAAVTMAGNSTITLASATAGILSSGAATISGASNILSVGGIAAAGSTYTLLSGASLTNTGAITLTGAAVGNQTLTLGSTGTIGRTTYTFGSTATALQLAVTGTVYDMVWNGGSSGAWDYTTANWQQDGTGSNIVSVQGDAATFGTASTVTVDSGTFGSTMQAASLTVNNAAGTVALSGSGVSVTGTFGKSGAGDLTIANAATYGVGAWVSAGSMTTSGSTVVTSGGLNVSGGSLTANAATVVTAGGLNVSGGAFVSNAATIVSAGGVNVSGGVATLNTSGTIAGGITVTGGTAAFNAANTVSGAVAASSGGAISLGSMSGVGAGSISLDNGTLISTLASGTLTNTVAVGAGGGTVANASGFTLASNVTGTSGITAAGPGELVISGTMSSSTTGMALSVASGASARLTGAAVKYFNNTGTVNGTLTFDNAALVMRTPAAMSGTGSIVLVGTTTLSGSTGVGATASITTPITGTGGLTVNGASSRYVILGGSNTYSGGTLLNGDVGAAVGSAFGTGSVTSLGTGARINNTSGGVLVLPNNLSTTSTTTNVLAFTGPNPIQITGTVTGAGILRASSSGIIDISQQTLATMQATGSIDMGNGGVIKASSADNFGSLAAILASGTPAPTLQALGNTGAITQAVKIGANNNNPVSFTIDTNGFAVTLAGVIQNLNSGTGGGITKAGSGTLKLTNANTYTGATTVSAGSLLVNGALDAASTVTVASAAALGGSGTIGGSVIFSAGANYTFDAASTLTVNGASVTFGGFGVPDLQGLSASTPDGTYTLMSGLTTFDLTNVSNVGSSNAYSLGGGKTAYLQTSTGPNGFQLVVVPEPTTMASVACGALLALLVMRRRATATDADAS